MSHFDPNIQEKQIDAKIVAALERLSEAFRIGLWEKSKATGLSPIQIQLLIYLAYHQDELCKVSNLALEFNLTKATISEAVRKLLAKKLVKKETDQLDSRSYVLHLTAKGKKAVDQTADFSDHIATPLKIMTPGEKLNFYQTLYRMVDYLHQSGIIQLQRMCFACRFYNPGHKGHEHFCNFLDKSLQTKSLRVDCPEFEAEE
ncbi:MAG: MarR family winged helix-turn-helix transcriptional regulator [Bacteroidota bacterium]